MVYGHNRTNRTQLRFRFKTPRLFLLMGLKFFFCRLHLTGLVDAEAAILRNHSRANYRNSRFLGNRYVSPAEFVLGNSACSAVWLKWGGIHAVPLRSQNQADSGWALWSIFTIGERNETSSVTVQGPFTRTGT